MKKLFFCVPRQPLKTQIFIGQKLLGKIRQLTDLSTYTQFVILVDSDLLKLAQAVKKELIKLGKPITIIFIKAKESEKTERQADSLITKVLKIRPPLDRNVLIFSLGGGIVGDIAGYVAGRLLRGVDFIQIPTTLLAMVDSSLGGKTGIDHDGITNMLGLFHLPKATIMDIDTLETLTARHWQAGMAELVKHALLDKDLFNLLSQVSSQTLRRNETILIKTLQLSAEFKMKIVSQDFEEREGQRKILNFGHTFGRAIESASDFSLSHGEAVALGMAVALKASLLKNQLNNNRFTSCLNLIKRFCLSRQIANLNLEAVKKAMSHDKKARLGKPVFVLLADIGKPIVDQQLDNQVIESSLKAVIGNRHE